MGRLERIEATGIRMPTMQTAANATMARRIVFSRSLAERVPWASG
jgi:hypothetical protein